MVYQVNGLALRTVREISVGSVNDIYVCEDINGPDNSYYEVLIIKNHAIAKRMVEVLGQEKSGDHPCYVAIFTVNEDFGIVFEYVKERLLSDFYMGKSFSLEKCEHICINLIMECIASTMPYPLLYLLLKQIQIHLQADESVHLGYAVELSELDAGIGEEDCVVVCASIIRDLLQSKAEQKATSYQLISKKIKKQSYRTFKDLYSDVKLSSVKPKKKGIFRRISAAMRDKSTTLFRILVVICSILVILALIALITQLVTGQIPFLRFFVNTFEYIGTESMRQ